MYNRSKANVFPPHLDKCQVPIPQPLAFEDLGVFRLSGKFVAAHPSSPVLHRLTASTRSLQMARQKSDGLQRLLNKQRTASKPYAPARRRAKKGHTLSSLQRVQLKIERQQRARALNDAIEDARDAVWEAAQKIYATFQSHSADYYFRMIMQTTRVKTRQRKTSRWNAFLSQELQRRNSGKSTSHSAFTS